MSLVRRHVRSRYAALLSLAILSVAAAGPAAAQGSTDRTVEQYLCKDVMRESGANRDVAIAFLHGFLLGKSRSSKFNVETLHKQTDAFIDLCLNNPNANAMEMMQKVRQ